jgi:hypothetical protein
MIGKTSVSMMVLLVIVAASLIGISSIYHYVEGQTPKLQQVQKAESATPLVRGQTQFTTLFPGKTCIAVVQLPGPDEPNTLGLKPGTLISVYAPPETCTLFGLSKIGNTPIQFDAQKMNPSSKTSGYRATQVTL